MSSLKSIKIFFIHPYPLGEAPGQRFRYEQYLDILKARKFELFLFPFLDSQTNFVLYKRGFWIKKILGVISGFTNRFALLFKIKNADYVFIFREATPFGPPIFELLVAKVFKKKIIYDFDDAIWATDKRNEGRIEKMIRWRSKVKSICKWSYKVSCGNEYLCDYAKQFNSNVVLNPTTIDTSYLHNPSLFKKEHSDGISIGWTGSHSTLKYLDIIAPVIKSLEQKHPKLRFIVIANKKPELNIKSLVFMPWSIDSEIQDLIQIDIGIMPLPDDEWSKGKCGFKLLQYMALNIPAVASPIGVNTKIIQNQINGFLCSNQEDWVHVLEQLINNPPLRSAIGEKGGVTVENDYSVSSNSDNFLSLFR